MYIYLVITYLSIYGSLDVQAHPVKSMQDCLVKQKMLHKETKAGKITSVCWKTEKEIKK